jgi:hypothetical protein
MGMLAEMKAGREERKAEMKAYQEKMDANLKEIKEDIRTNQARTEANHEIMMHIMKR